jgi:transglutaminase-like putative cysteine protease
MSERHRQRRHPVSRPFGRELGATLAVAAFSIAVAAGFARVFSGWDFMTDLILVALAGHGVGLLLRRLRLSGWLAVPITAVALIWLIAAVYYPDTFSWGLPTGATWDLFTTELADVRSQFRTAVAPVIYGAGWDVLAAIGLAIAVLLADVFAFRALARAETLVPGGVLFVFVAAVGDDRLRVALTVSLIAVGVATTAVLRTYYSPTPGRSTTSMRRLWPAVIAIALIVGASAGFIGPRLPGADAAPLYETRGRGGGVTEVLSPLVDIRSRLTNRSDNVLFEVRADFESYWRSSALPEFDGRTWGLPDQPLQSADETLGAPREGAMQLRQEITIRGLGGTLVPAAPDPFQATGPSDRNDLRWVPATSTLVMVDDDLERGDVISIVSASPRFDPAELAVATSTDAGNDVYTALPDGLPPVVAETARKVTAGSNGPYEAARMLQAWFQREFDYSLEVQSGHGNDAIESFLREKIGYCEQFAGTYAAMMRTLGYPSRVAVGFTSGTETSPGTFSVEGRNAHAWPEVWFDDIGWVAFEPTPGRGAPGAENYTGLPPAQDAPTDDQATAEVDGSQTPPTTVALGAIDQQFDPNFPQEFADPTGAGQTVDTESANQQTSTGQWSLVVVALLGLLALAPAVVRRIRSRFGRHTPEQQLARLWGTSVDALRVAGVPVAASKTPNETAAATAVHFPIVARPVALLADAVTVATYRPEGAQGYETVGTYGSSTMRNCQNWARQIDRAVHDSVPLPERVRRYFTNWG